MPAPTTTACAVIWLVDTTGAISAAASNELGNTLRSCDAANSLEGRRLSATTAICVVAAAAAACCWRSTSHRASVCASVQSPFDEHSRIALRRSLPLVVFGTERSRKMRT
eukprot:scaffold104274_cov73-Phaeocystis_antarctica.AAC.3